MAKLLPIALTLSVAVIVAMPGCGGAGSNPSVNTASTAIQQARTIAPKATQNLVYVSDQLEKAVLAFPASEHAKNPPPVQTLDLGVIPEGIWVDRDGILYVALSGKTATQAGQVEEFKPGASTPFRTITDGISVPQNLIVDAHGTLYVDQIFDLAVQILEYPAGHTSPATTLEITDKGEPAAGGITLDKHGNLYIHASFIDDPPSRVYEFPHGKTIAKDLHLNGLGDVSGLSGDEHGNLYVADANANISVYAAGQKNAMRTIEPPANNVFDGFATTRSGKLYVAQGAPGYSPPSLLEYAVGGSRPVNVLSGHLQGPVIPALRDAAF